MMLLLVLMLYIIQIITIIDLNVFDPVATDEGVEDDICKAEDQKKERKLNVLILSDETLKRGDDSTTTYASDDCKLPSQNLVPCGKKSHICCVQLTYL